MKNTGEKGGEKTNPAKRSVDCDGEEEKGETKKRIQKERPSLSHFRPSFSLEFLDQRPQD